MRAKDLDLADNFGGSKNKSDRGIPTRSPRWSLLVSPIREGRYVAICLK
jgi:hypothetical protein